MNNTIESTCESEPSSYTNSPQDLYINLTFNSLNTRQTLQVLEDFYKQLKTCDKLKETQFVIETIRAMQYMCLSPISLIKNEAVKITTQCLRYLDIVTVQEKFPITAIPILSIDTKTLLKFYPSEFIINNVKLIVHHVLRLFMSNVYDQDGGMLYEALLIAIGENYMFWQCEVGDLFSTIIVDDSEGPFHQSLLKYWLPKSLNHFKNNFYNFIAQRNFPLNIKLHTVLLAKKRGMTSYLESIESFCGPRQYLMNEEPQLMMEVLNVANQKNLDDCFLLGEESDLVIYYLTSLCDTDSHHNPFIKKFITKLFVAGHVYIDDTVYIDKLFQIFCHFYETALRFIEEGEEAGGFIIKVIWEVATENPNKLVVEGYSLKPLDKTNENNFYKYLLTYGWWNCNMASSEFGLLLYNYFTILPSVNVCELLTKRYASTITDHGMNEIDDIFDEYANTSNLLGIEEFKLYCKLIITTFEITGTIACISYFKTKIKDISQESILNERILMGFALLAQVLTQIDHQYDHIVCNVLNSSIQVICYIVENKLHEDMDQTNIKILERFMIDTCSQSTRYDTVTDMENNLLNLTKIIQMCNMKRPSMEAAKAMKIVSVKLGKSNKTKLLILNEAIESLKEQTSIKLSIRKNPQTRLVIHALSLPIEGDCSILLATITRLHAILKSRNATNVGVAFTFNCLELIMDDVQFHSYTFKYLPDLFKICLDYFDDSDFVVRNALLQLFNVVIRRILGAKAVNGRYYSTADIYPLYKHLIKYLIDYTSNVYCDSLNLVIQFFTELLNRYCPFENQEFTKDTRKLQDIFYGIFTKGVTKLQRLNAAKAYVSCLRSEDVYDVLIKTLAQTDVRRMKEHNFLVQYLVTRLEDIYVTPLHQDEIKKMMMVFKIKMQFCSFCSGTSGAELLQILQKVNIKTLVDIFCDLCRQDQTKSYNGRQIFLEALQLRYRECVIDMDLANELLNHILLYILRHTDMDMDYVFKCLDLVDCLTNSANIIVNAEVVDLANEINCDTNIPHLIVLTLIAKNRRTDKLRQYMNKLLELTFLTISRNLVTIRMRTILLYIHKFSTDESDIEYLIKYIFLIMFRSNIQHVCYDTLHRMGSKHPKSGDEAFDILLNLTGNLQGLISYLKCLTFFQTYIARYVLKTQDDVKFYETNDKDDKLAYKVLNLCEKQVDELNES